MITYFFDSGRSGTTALTAAAEDLKDRARELGDKVTQKGQELVGKTQDLVGGGRDESGSSSGANAAGAIDGSGAVPGFGKNLDRGTGEEIYDDQKLIHRVRSSFGPRGFPLAPDPSHR